MKKLLSFLIALSFATPLYAADQWLKDTPIGTESSGTIDDLMRVNQEAQDRLLNGYKRGLGVNYATASTLTVLPGEISIPNAAVSVVKYRETTTDTPITWADIDTGAEATSTQYYLYVTADTDITGMVFKISTSASLPSGSTYYRLIASFYNDSSGNITNVISYRPDYGTDYLDVVKGWINFNGTGTIAINDQYNVSSITDNGTGDYTITWSTAFASAYYACAGTTGASASGPNLILYPTSPMSTTSIRVQNVGSDGAANIDGSIITLFCVGDRT